MPNTDPSQLSSNTASDIGYETGNALLSSIPVVGALLSASFGLALESPYKNRVAKWADGVHNRLEGLSSSIEYLQSNEHFISMLAIGCSIVVESHDEEKLTAVQNAIVNSSGNVDIEKETQQIFLNLLRRFTVTHIQMLSTLSENKPFGRPKHKESGYHSVRELILRNMPHLESSSGLCDIVFEELVQCQFVRVADSMDGISRNIDTQFEWNEFPTNLVTPLGNSFLAFILTDLVNQTPSK